MSRQPGEPQTSFDAEAHFKGTCKFSKMVSSVILSLYKTGIFVIAEGFDLGFLLHIHFFIYPLE